MQVEGLLTHAKSTSSTNSTDVSNKCFRQLKDFFTPQFCFFSGNFSPLFRVIMDGQVGVHVCVTSVWSR